MLISVSYTHLSENNLLFLSFCNSLKTIFEVLLIPFDNFMKCQRKRSHNTYTTTSFKTSKFVHATLHFLLIGLIINSNMNAPFEHCNMLISLPSRHMSPCLFLVTRMYRMTSSHRLVRRPFG